MHITTVMNWQASTPKRRPKKAVKIRRKTPQQPHHHKHHIGVAWSQGRPQQRRTASAATPNVFCTSGTMCTCRKNNGHSNNLVHELHGLDHDPCRCTQQACQRPCRITAPAGNRRERSAKCKPATRSNMPLPLSTMKFEAVPLLQSLSLTITGMSTTLSKDWTTQMNLHNRDIIHVEILQL